MTLTVTAQTVRSNNNAGGEIVLTTTVCPDKDMSSTLLGYTYTSEGDTFWFCFTVVETDILAVYLDDQSVKRYDLNNFYVTQ